MDTCQYRFTAYLITAVKHERMRYYRRRERLHVNELLLEEPDFERFSYEPDFLHNINGQALECEDEQLERVLSQLPQQDRIFLSWKFVFQLKHAEIAQQLGISKIAADKRYQRILEKLRRGYFHE